MATHFVVEENKTCPILTYSTLAKRRPKNLNVKDDQQCPAGTISSQ